MTRSPWSRLPASTQAFLGAGVCSIAHLLLPAGKQTTLAAVYACVACAGVLSFRELARLSRQPNGIRTGFLIPGLTRSQTWLTRGLELVSIMVSVLVIVGILG